MKKRLPRGQYLKRRAFDVNLERILAAGRAARSAGQAITTGPDLRGFVGLRRAALEAAWRQGWRERDAEMDKWLPYREDA